MKTKFLVFVFFAMLNVLSLQAFWGEETACESVCDLPRSPPSGIVAEFRPSYFYPTSSSFRELFPGGNVNYQLTATFPAYYGSNIWERGINVWAAVDYFSQSSHSIGAEPHSSIKVRIVPLTLGLKYFFPSFGEVVPVNFYVGSGMKYFFVHTHNDSPYVESTINRNGMGGVFEAGFLATYCENFVLDAFVSYSIKSFGAPTVSDPVVETTGFNVSNLNVGGGIGYKF